MDAITMQKLEDLRSSTLVLDLETSASYPDGEPINIKTNFDDYVKYAKAKWFGCYSYKYDIYVCDEVLGNEDKIRSFIAEHSVIVGFNSDEFDIPILYNNDLMPEKRFLLVDCMVVLGDSVFRQHSGLPFKMRGKLMGYKFKNNSLKSMAKAMKLESQKGDIDYEIFFKNYYTDDERKEIIKYLEGDVKSTKQMFDKLWDFWYPFTKFLSEKNILNLSWIKSSIASLRYKGDCNILGVEETYSDDRTAKKEEMGGRVINPKYEEARGVMYLDFGSLYPWIRNMFNIDAEITDGTPEKELELYGELSNTTFHGNELFKVKGFYDITQQHLIALKSIENLTTRKMLKDTDPDNPLIYTIKIYENAGYGALRSPIFEQIHKPNGGWDICWLGQQMNHLVEKMMDEFGFETIAGDTDSVFVLARQGTENTKRYVQECLQKIIDKILANVPFPNKNFVIDIENYIEYMMWPFSEENVVGEDGKNLKNEKGRLIKEYKGKKKNYVYVYFKDGEKKVKIVGLPIKKDNATILGQKILKERLIPLIKTNVCAKFDKSMIDKFVEEELSKPDGLTLLACEFRVKPAETYKKDSQIQAQISTGYFNGQAGIISLIKNKKFGNAGKGTKYCSISEAIEHKLEVKDLDLTKLNNELKPFIRRKEK